MSLFKEFQTAIEKKQHGKILLLLKLCPGLAKKEAAEHYLLDQIQANHEELVEKLLLAGDWPFSPNRLMQKYQWLKDDNYKQIRACLERVTMTPKDETEFEQSSFAKQVVPPSVYVWAQHVLKALTGHDYEYNESTLYYKKVQKRAPHLRFEGSLEEALKLTKLLALFKIPFYDGLSKQKEEGMSYIVTIPRSALECLRQWIEGEVYYPLELDLNTLQIQPELIKEQYFDWLFAQEKQLQAITQRFEASHDLFPTDKKEGAKTFKDRLSSYFTSWTISLTHDKILYYYAKLKDDEIKLAEKAAKQLNLPRPDKLKIEGLTCNQKVVLLDLFFGFNRDVVKNVRLMYRHALCRLLPDHLSTKEIPNAQPLSFSEEYNSSEAFTPLVKKKSGARLNH